MANVTATDLTKKILHMAEFGNAVSEDFPALALTGVNATEKAYLGIIPAGTRVHEMRLVTSGTLGASTSVDLGYEPVDGSSPAAVNNYWLNDLTSTAALNSVSAAEPITFNKAVKIVLLVNTANVTGSPTATVYYQGKVVGAP
jgi:hypothetical protein